MFKKLFLFGLLFTVAVATIVVTPKNSQAQGYFGGYGGYQTFYQPYESYYGPYNGYPRLYVPSYGYPNVYRPFYGGNYGYGYPGYYGTYPRYGFYPGYNLCAEIRSGARSTKAGYKPIGNERTSNGDFWSK